jgi:hypothetical protein
VHAGSDRGFWFAWVVARSPRRNTRGTPASTTPGAYTNGFSWEGVQSTIEVGDPDVDHSVVGEEWVAAWVSASPAEGGEGPWLQAGWLEYAGRTGRHGQYAYVEAVASTEEEPPAQIRWNFALTSGDVYPFRVRDCTGLQACYERCDQKQCAPRSSLVVPGNSSAALTTLTVEA